MTAPITVIETAKRINAESRALLADILFPIADQKITKLNALMGWC